MTNEDRAILIEMQELRIQLYREWAEKITRNSIARGYTIPQSEPENALSAQVHTAWLGYVVLSRLRPVLDAVYALAKQSGGIEQLLNKAMKESGAELEIDEIPDFAVNLVSYVSQAATANGLPPCQYYGEWVPSANDSGSIQ